MKKQFFNIIILISVNLVIAQKGIIQYGYIEALGIGNAKGPDSNAYLVFNKEQSYYVTAKDSLENDANIKEQKSYDREEGGGAIYNGIKVSPQGDQVVYHINKKTMWSNLLYGNQLYIKESAPIMQWKIEKETKKIGKLDCKKATTLFRGRYYTAWFTIEISLPFGPWKLNGLPGLILEAYDTNKNVYWYFKSVEYPSNTKENVKYLMLPKKLKWLTYIEFKEVQKNEMERIEDKNKILSKQLSNVSFESPKLNQMFIECE